MQSTTPSSTFLDIFDDVQDFIQRLNPKKYAPPLMTTIFSPMRKLAFHNIQTDCSNSKDNIAYFISKFENEYIEMLRSKLRERYVDVVLQNNYEIPDQINIKEAQNYGAIPELAQLAIAIAEWTLELEINAYTLEGLELYGLIGSQKKKNEDYFELLKKEYSYKQRSTITNVAWYLFRKAMSFSCGKLSSLAMAKGMSKGAFQIQTITETVLSLSSIRQIPWKTIAGSMDVHWMIGGVICSHFLEKLNDYSAKREVFSYMNEVQETFEAHKLHLMTERKTMLDLVEKIIYEEDKTKHRDELEALLVKVNEVLKPHEHNESNAQKKDEIASEEKNKLFKVTEENDLVVVEEKKFKEKLDDSGVVVVDW